MLIPVQRRKSSQPLSVVAAAEEGETDAATTPVTYVSVVSVEYSWPPRAGITVNCRLPPKIVWASRRPATAQVLPSQPPSMGPNCLPTHFLHKSNRQRILTVTCPKNFQEMRQQIRGLRIHRSLSQRRLHGL
ncbi:hypothetical protein ACOMHN_002346 [Nucella lapillus]